MESNWRLNVAIYGMVGSDWRLCARYTDDPTVALVQVKGSPNQKYQRFYVGDPSQLPAALGPQVPAQGHFPYGEEVEPD